MTPDQLDWPPPVCEACRPRVDEDGTHLSPTHDCNPVPFCTCDCPWLYEEVTDGR